MDVSIFVYIFLSNPARIVKLNSALAEEIMLSGRNDNSCLLLAHEQVRKDDTCVKQHLRLVTAAQKKSVFHASMGVAPLTQVP